MNSMDEKRAESGTPKDELFLDEPLVMNVQDLKEAAKLAKQEERWKRKEEKQAKKDQKEQERWERRQEDEAKDVTDKVGVSDWFVTLCLTNIPIINVLYLLFTAIRKQNPQPKRSFAVAYLLYRALVWVLAFTILYILLMMGTDFVDGIMSFLKAYNLAE